MTSDASALLSLLHDCAVFLGGNALRVPTPGRRLLALLAVRRRAVPRPAVAAALWPDLTDTEAASRLRSALWRLPSVPHPDGLIVSATGGLALAPSVEVDVHRAERTEPWTAEDAAAWGGELLADWDDSWLVPERERFRQLRLHRLEQLSSSSCRAGRFDAALQAGLAAVASDPLRESAHRAVITAHLAEQNPAEALRQYEQVRVLLRDALGLPPSPATRALVQPYLGRPLDRLAG